MPTTPVGQLPIPSPVPAPLPAAAPAAGASSRGRDVYAITDDITNLLNTAEGGNIYSRPTAKGKDGRGNGGSLTFSNLDRFMNSSAAAKLSPDDRTKLSDLVRDFAAAAKEQPGWYLSNRTDGKHTVDVKAAIIIEKLNADPSATAPGATAPAPAPGAGAPAAAGGGAPDPTSSIPPGLQQAINKVKGYSTWSAVPDSYKTLVPSLKNDELTAMKSNIKKTIYRDKPTKADPEIDNARDLKTLLQKLFDSSDQNKKIIGTMMLANFIYSASQPPASQPPASQPPASQPPASQPPASQPPASEPEPTLQPPARPSVSTLELEPPRQEEANLTLGSDDGTNLDDPALEKVGNRASTP
jgi:hypothetical protein